jgi:hypothetical protein
LLAGFFGLRDAPLDTRRERAERPQPQGFGWAVVTDPLAAQVPLSRGSQWGGVYGHSWLWIRRRSTVVALPNTVLEGMWGRFKVDLREAI